uniref:non-specific serine/threonine protein kinase n=1 Tax=Eptatretus burgeri TaxID=7764 RepID=A0A8C4QWJ7_EPTBU
MADHRLEEAEVCHHPLLPLCHFRGTVTALLLVQTGVGVSQGLEPPLKVLDRLPHDLVLILPELCLLVHPPVVGLLGVPEDGVLAKEIAHDLLLMDIKTKLRLLGPLLRKGWPRVGGGHARSYRWHRRCPRGVEASVLSVRGCFLFFVYLHKKNIVHRDIKLSNVLCNNLLVVKVIDFGCATIFKPDEKLHQICGTRSYMAPEISIDVYEGPPVDVWSLGIVFIQLLVGLDFDGSDLAEQMSDDVIHKKVVSKLPPHSSYEFLTLLVMMTLKDPILRLTMQDISEHTWFKQWPTNFEDTV